jgi:hypothetical protein
VVYFRKLIEKTVGYAYPLPDITAILDQLGQSKYLTCSDMVMGYHQIELARGKNQKLPSALNKGTGNTEKFRLG